MSFASRLLALCMALALLLACNNQDQPQPQVEVIDLVLGTGDTATFADTVDVLYRGTLFTTGAEYVSNYGTGPSTTVLGAGFLGFTFEEAIEGMREGGQRQITVPYGLSFDTPAAPPTQDVVIYYVQLTDVR